MSVPEWFTNSLSERFDRLYSPEPNSGCWLWTASVMVGGYGKMSVYRDGTWRTTKASHIALAQAGKALEPGQVACHRCDNPYCVNPGHLFVGTQADNISDAMSKRRLKAPPIKVGIANNRTKISDHDVINIRSMWNNGMTMDQIGRHFDINPGTARRIALGESRSTIPSIESPRRGKWKN